MNLGLDQKVALITGGSKGIGFETARLMLEEGCSVAIVARSAEGIDRAASQLDGKERLLGLTGDMVKTEDAEAAVKETLDRFGHVDILITCAGSSPGGLVENLTEDQWFASLGLKFMGYVRSCKAVLPHMRERGEGIVTCWWSATMG